MKVYNLYIIALTVLLLSGCKQENRNYNYEEAVVAETGTAILENSEEATDAYNPYPEYNFEGEGYTETIENAFENPATKPLSTFSIDVDNASYTNIRRMISNGEKIPIGAVRVEEMINFFKYNYPQPTGNQPFSINTELNDCPWNKQHKLLKIGLQGKIIQNNNLPPSSLVFLIDVSGSMEDDNKLPLLKESMKVLLEELRPEDKVSIVVYAGGEGIVMAYQLAEDNFIKGGNNRIILATDGDFNVGVSSENELQKLIEQKRKSGIFLTCLGFGTGNLQDNVMEILADKGNGNYAYIDTIQEANRFLGKEFKGSMFAIAKDVKIQIEFNPRLVQSYRLIGYENRKLNDEDFKNDVIDAGELGSGHSVTALYEIIPSGIESQYSPTKLKYTPSKTIISQSNELATIKFRYKKPSEDTSNEIVKTIPNSIINSNIVSDDFKFAASVAWFGLKLRDSKYIEYKDINSIKSLAKKAVAIDEDGYRSEFVRLIESTN